MKSINILKMGPLMPYLERRLDDLFNVIDFSDVSKYSSEENISSITAIVTSTKYRVSSELLQKFHAVEIVSSFGVGIEHLPSHKDIYGAKIFNTPEVLNEDTSNMALALVLAATRNIVLGDRYVRDSKWGMSPPLQLGVSLSGKVAGIVGMGQIGLMVAQKMSVFGCEIQYHNRSPRSDINYYYHNSLLSLAHASDILIVTLPGGDDTHHLINANILAALGSGGWFINIARGSVVDEEALINALDQGIIRGAGLDVFEHEPDVPEALMKMSNVVLQPHQASATEETRCRMADCVVNNLLNHFDL